MICDDAPQRDGPTGKADVARSAEQDFPLVFANLPADRHHQTVATGVAFLLVAAAVAIAPFASIQLGRIDAFIPVLQTALAIADGVTASLLFAQYAIQPQRALLAVASAYICSGSFAFLQTLSFPGGYAPNGLIGDGLNTPGWLYVLWHTTFPAAILIYALTKHTDGAERPRGSIRATILATVAAVMSMVAVLTWIVATKAQYLPSFYTDDVRQQTQFGNQINLVLALWGATTLAVLLSRRHTILDLWLLVTLLACMPNFLVAMFASSVRFSVGWYAARGFVLVSSCMLLVVLIIETMLLYSRLASAIALQRRELAYRNLSIQAVTGALAHELRSPLAAITLNANTARLQLRSAPVNVADIEELLGDIEADGLRAGAIISSIRELTTKGVHQGTSTNPASSAQLALRLLKHDLRAEGITVTAELEHDLPDVSIDGLELQQVLLNLVRNAMDAMKARPAAARLLQLKASFDGQSNVVVSVHDSGPGIPDQYRERIFDPFFSTKLEGMGLGLGISANLIEKNGGKLRLGKSSSEGSVFELVLPVAG
ncbi:MULTISPECIES: sensor histidine kinase [unclassified Bradyrhizobium]|uniref:sensor histidine kinase n=1 Tax=unclassified Bradyrhizobium TaxID=2631580 RepID=UPI00230512E9|nr:MULTISPECIES: MASE4 domain-containing protein [unclassified Bradyrhizobium]MDA9408524.1 histidine kinase [Bradyrhizobium sp. CCBAU 45384]MDA9444725.1 histidine kinase [Bradyrhizobium sp. CCBAU 51745]